VSGIQNFFGVLVFESPTHKTFQVNQPIRSCVSPEYKIQDGSAGFRKEPCSSGPQLTNNISGKSEQVLVELFDRNKSGKSGLKVGAYLVANATKIFSLLLKYVF
jgi:hypothetical protein